MAYTRVNWENLPSTNTPLNATNLNKMDAGIKDLDEQVNNLPKKVKQNWGTSMSFEMQTGQHALVMLNQTDCLMIWVAGSSDNPSMSLVRLYGNDAQVSLNGNTITINYGDNRDFTGNAIIL